MTKSTGNSRFGHIYWRNLKWKTSFFVQWHIWMTISEVEKVYFNSIKQALLYLVKFRYKDRIQTSLPFATSGNIQVDDQELTEFNHSCSTQSVVHTFFWSGVTCTEADYYISLVNRIKVFFDLIYQVYYQIFLIFQLQCHFVTPGVSLPHYFTAI